MTIPVRSAAVRRLRPSRHADRGSAGGDRVPGEIQRSNTRGVPARPQVLLPMGSRPRPRPRRNLGSHRDVPLHDGTTRPCGIDDRSRLSTARGYFRFAPIDGRIPANPAQYVRRPKVQPNERHRMDRGELARFLFTAEHFDRDHPCSPCCLASTDCACPRCAQPTSTTSASNAVTAHSASSVRETSRRRFRSCPTRQAGRGEVTQRGDARPQAPHQRRRLPTPHRRRPSLTAAPARTDEYPVGQAQARISK